MIMSARSFYQDKKVRRWIAGCVAAATVVGFTLMNPLVGCYDDASRNVMVVRPINDARYKEYKSAKNKEEFVINYVRNRIFSESAPFLERVLRDDSLDPTEKWNILNIMYVRYDNIFLDYVLEKLKDRKYLDHDVKGLSDGERKTIGLLSRILSYEKDYLIKYAEYLSRSTSTLKSILMILENKHPILLLYFKDSLIFRSRVKDVEDAFSIAKEIMENDKYSTLVSLYAAMALIEIDREKGRLDVLKYSALVLNPIKSYLLKDIANPAR